MKLPDRRTIHVALSEKTYQRLNDLREETESASMSDVIRRAVAAYSLLVDAEANGSTLSMRDTDGNETAVRVLT